MVWLTYEEWAEEWQSAQVVSRVQARFVWVGRIFLWVGEWQSAQAVEQVQGRFVWVDRIVLSAGEWQYLAVRYWD